MLCRVGRRAERAFFFARLSGLRGDEYSSRIRIIVAGHGAGLDVVECNSAGAWPSVTWSTDDHTGVPVDTHTWGKNADRFAGTVDNTEFFTAITAGP